MPVLLYERKTVISREKEISMISAVQMDNLRGLLGIRVDRMLNPRVREHS